MFGSLAARRSARICGLVVGRSRRSCSIRTVASPIVALWTTPGRSRLRRQPPPVVAAVQQSAGSPRTRSKTMALTFHPDWKTAKPHYVAKFGEYQAFLDSMTQTDVVNALHGACGKFHPGIDAWMQTVSNGSSDAIVEQGSHQA